MTAGIKCDTSRRVIYKTWGDDQQYMSFELKLLQTMSGKYIKTSYMRM